MHLKNFIMKKLELQNYINHISFVVDKSFSMHGHIRSVEKVFDNQIEFLKNKSSKLSQETRVSIYEFSSKVNCLVFDKDVMRIPSLVNSMTAWGNTALIDAAVTAIQDMQNISQKYGDHAFLLYILTDGEENSSSHTERYFIELLKKLKDNWTIACMVPDARAVFSAKSIGIPANNISIWKTTRDGIEKLGRDTEKALDNYITLRSKGIRSTSNFYQTDLSNLNKKVVQTKLDVLPADQYKVFRVSKKDGSVIKPFCESWLGEPYRVGSAYYQLVKPEEIQANKQICIRNKRDGRVYFGDSARNLLNLPNYNLKVKPGDHGEWDIFIQSTSVNRKLPYESHLIVLT
jgi:hypothetical protein